MPLSTKKPLAFALSLSLFGSALVAPSALQAKSISSTSAASAASDVKSEDVRDGRRLSPSCRPVSYDLYFEPDLEKGEFEGKETVFLDLSAPTRTISLNALDMSVYEASIASAADPSDSKNKSSKAHGEFVKGEISKDEKRQLVTFTFKDTLKPGRYELALKFNAKLGERLAGFYLSTFKSKKDGGKEHKIATTQMEPTDARRMFPCFDEPGMKATFKISVGIPTNMVAISNAAVEFEKTDQRRNLKIVNFRQTPRMSTYLVALCVGEFKSSKEEVVNGKKIRVWAVDGKEHLTDYALKTAAKLLPYYEKYFGVDYPFEKLDLIAIPDFAAGAMENWGAITFRETALLVDEESSTGAKMNVVGIIAHEMAHLWFGDLVTMKWWNGLWLNEAFATWMATKATDHLRPDWRVWDEFGGETAYAIESDGLLATRPVEFAVKSPEDAMEMFDEITYEKGGSILRMLETYLTEEKFQEGIQRYMKAHAFNNATTADLWQALSSKSIDVNGLMQTWVFSPGCPQVDFDFVAGKNKSKNDTGRAFSINLNQKRYLRSPEAPKYAKGQPPVWQIPLVLKGEGYNERVLFEKTSQTQTVKAESAPLFLNGSGNGFFRTNYSKEQLEKLFAVDKGLTSFLSPKERISFYSDLFSLSFCGLSPLDNYLKFSQSMPSDEDSYVLSHLINQTQAFSNFIDESHEKAYGQFVVSRLKKPLDRLTMERKPGETELVSQLRGKLVRALGTYGQDAEIIEYCRGKFDLYLADDKSLDPDMLAAIVNVVAHNGDHEEYARLVQHMKLADTPEAYQRDLFSLASFRKKELVTNTLSMVLGKDVRAQDGPRLIGRLVAALYSRAEAWQFVQDNWDKLGKKFDAKHLPDLVEAAAAFSTDSEYKSLSDFIDKHPLPNGRRSQAKALELSKINIRFRQNSLKALESYLVKP